MPRSVADRRPTLRWGGLALGVVALAIGCQPETSSQTPTSPAVPSPPSPVAPSGAEPERVAEPAAQPAVAVVEPQAQPEPPPDTPAPEFKPLKLSEEQLKRARAVQPLVAAASAEYGIDPNLINGIIWTESKFNPKARNRSGAKGLMQLMPVTARGMAKKLGRKARPYDPEFSVQAGSKLLSIMLDRFEGDEELALFAFARGGGRVRGWIADGETEMPAGVVKFIARVRRGQRTFTDLGFPNNEA